MTDRGGAGPDPGHAADGGPGDPVLVRRARYARLSSLGQRIGYGLLVVAIASFAVGLASGFPPASAAVTVGALIGACVVMPPAIIGGFAVRAADREDREEARRSRHRPPVPPSV